MTSTQYGMFTPDGDAAVTALVGMARMKARRASEATALAVIAAWTERIAADTGTHPYYADLAGTPGEAKTGMREVCDTAVREAVEIGRAHV